MAQTFRIKAFVLIFKFNYLFIYLFIYLYLDTCFLYYKGLVAFIFEHIMYKKFYVTGLQNTTATRYFRYYPCIMRILIFPSKMWAKDAHYTQQNTVLSLSSHSAPALSHLSPHLFSFWVQHRCSAVVYLCGYSVCLLSLPLWAPVSFAAVSPAPGVGPGTSKVLSNIKGMNG